MSETILKKSLFVAIAMFLICSNLHANEDIVWEKNFGINSAFFSPDGSKIYATTTSKFFILDTETGEVLQEYENAYGDLVGISPDGLYAYTSKSHRVNIDTYESVANLDMDISESDWSLYSLKGYKVSADGNFLFYIGSGNYKPDGSGPSGQDLPLIIKFNAETMKYISHKTLSTIYEGTGRDIALSNDGKFIAVATDGYYIEYNSKKTLLDNRLLLYDTETLEQIAELGVWDDEIDITNLTFSPDSKMLATIVDGQIHLYDTETFEEIEGIECIQEFSVYTYSFSNNSNYLLFGTKKHDNYQTRVCHITPCYIKHTIDLYSSRMLLESPTSQYLLSVSSLGDKLIDIEGLLAYHEETKEFSILYPNPVNNTITSDINSNLMYSGDIFNQDIFTYDVSEFTSGTYFLQLISNQNSETYKFIKE